MTNRDLQAIHSAEKLREEAARLLTIKPSSQIKISDITKGCGLSKGSFYHYFSSKAECLVSLCFSQNSGFLDVLQQNDFSGSYIDRLISSLHIYLSCLLYDETDILRRNIIQYKMTDEYRELRNKMYTKDYVIHRFMEYFENGIQLGVFSEDIPSLFISQTITFSVIYGADWQLALYGSAPELEAWLDNFCDTLVNVLLRPYIKNP